MNLTDAFFNSSAGRMFTNDPIKAFLVIMVGVFIGIILIALFEEWSEKRKKETK